MRARDLVNAMNVVDGTGRSPYVFDMTTIEDVTASTVADLSSNGPWIAGMEGHAILVRGISEMGNVAVYDPIGARSYELSLADFAELLDWKWYLAALTSMRRHRSGRGAAWSAALERIGLDEGSRSRYCHLSMSLTGRLLVMTRFYRSMVTN